MGPPKLSPPKQSLNTGLTDKRNLVIVIPSFNDWEALEKLLLLIDEIILPQGTNLEGFNFMAIYLVGSNSVL